MNWGQSKVGEFLWEDAQIIETSPAKGAGGDAQVLLFERVRKEGTIGKWATGIQKDGAGWGGLTHFSWHDEKSFAKSRFETLARSRNLGDRWTIHPLNRNPYSYQECVKLEDWVEVDSRRVRVIWKGESYTIPREFLLDEPRGVASEIYIPRYPTLEEDLILDIHERLSWDLVVIPSPPIKDFGVEEKFGAEALRKGLLYWWTQMNTPPTYIHLSPRDVQFLVEEANQDKALDRLDESPNEWFRMQSSLRPRTRNVLGLLGAFDGVPVLASWMKFGVPIITQKRPHERNGNNTIRLHCQG